MELPLDALPVVLPGPLPPIAPPAAGADGELEGELEEAEPALDGLEAVLRRGWPFESLQCVEAEMVLLLAPAGGDEVDCAETETAPKHRSVVASIRDLAIGALLGLLPPHEILLPTRQPFHLNLDMRAGQKFCDR